MTTLPQPCLMLVTDRALAGGSQALVRAVAAAVEAGVNALQLRERGLPDDELLALARRLQEVSAGRALLLVNGRLQVALAAGADGVHLPEAAPWPQRPRPGFLLGRSVHSLEAARRAQAEGADYLIAGPVYETPSHPGAPPAGPGLVREVAAAAGIPVLAIGGLSAARVGEVVEAGAAGVAVISAVLAAPSPAQAARELWGALQAAWAEARAARP